MSNKKWKSTSEEGYVFPDRRDVGNRIAMLRIQKDLTEAALAEKMGFSLKHINAVECGRANVSLQFLLIAARELDTSVDYLLFGREYPDLPPALPRTVMEILEQPQSAKYRLLTEYCRLLAKMKEEPED